MEISCKRNLKAAVLREKLISGNGMTGFERLEFLISENVFVWNDPMLRGA